MRAAVNVSLTGAEDWASGFVTGNGRQGAVCHGGPRCLRTTLSHERLFLPVHEPLVPPGTARILPRLRELCLAGRFQAAADAVVALAVAEDPRYGELREADPFIGAATLSFTPRGRAGAVAGWRRTVDHGTGVVAHEWRDRTGFVRQEVFVSRPDDAVVLRWSARGPLSGRLSLHPIAGTPPAPIVFAATGEGRPGGAVLRLRATFPGAWAGAVTGYAVVALVHARGGQVTAEPGGAVVLVDVAGCTVVARSTVDPEPEVALPQPDFDGLLARHAPAHRALFDRCRLTLAAGGGEAGGGSETTAGGGGAGGGSETTGAGVETEALLGRASPALIERLFDAGRYAIICSAGTLPPNLQGVWSGTYHPAWRGGYTMDGNLAAALAAVCVTGTPELLLPLFDLLDRVRADLRENGRRLYGIDGPLLPPHLTTHGRHNHFTARWCLTFWTAGAAWMARLYHEYWRFTGDRAFLAERALPFLRAAAEFYAAFLVPAGGGLAFVPSYSPENSPSGPDGPQASINATMDVAAVRGLFLDLAELDEDGARWRELAGRLPGYRIDADGALAEWVWPGLAGNHAHRHASHLYGLWYEPDPSLVDDDELAPAAAAAVRQRLAWWRRDGDEAAFGLAQVGLAAAALGLAAEAYEALVHLATRFWRPNLVSTHNMGSLFNTDLCGALPALVVAMLVQSRGETVRLLPAWPSAWPAGRLTGVLLRGGVRVARLDWSPRRVAVELVGDGSPAARTRTVRAGGAAPLTVALPAGRPVRLEFPPVCP